MFYVKQQHQGCSIRVDITDENVFTDCVSCGKEIQVDLQQWAEDEDFDLCGTSAYCQNCSQRR